MNKVSRLPVDFRQPSLLTLELAGPFCLRDAAGVDLTPRCRKAQGLLALVATARNFRRSRAWLQDKLWSDRGPEQGAASLRQCLTGIRAVLGEHVDALRTEGGWVSLDPQRVRVLCEPAASDDGDEVEFLEGLDIRDPEFEHWLRDQRLHFFEKSRTAAEAADAEPEPELIEPVSRTAIGVTMHRLPDADDADRMLSDFVQDVVLRFLLDHAGVDVIDFRAGNERARQAARPFWRLRITSCRLGERVRVSMMLSETGSERVLWADAATFARAELYGSEEVAVGELARGATARIAGTAARRA
jgi:hypothetical protein